jgi:hypothetical protein
MKTVNSIPPAVAAIIPYVQLWYTKASQKDFSEEIQGLEEQLKKCPKIGETDGMEEHPAIFSLFHGPHGFMYASMKAKKVYFSALPF